MFYIVSATSQPYNHNKITKQLISRTIIYYAFRSKYVNLKYWGRVLYFLTFVEPVELAQNSHCIRKGYWFFMCKSRWFSESRSFSRFTKNKKRKWKYTLISIIYAQVLAWPSYLKYICARPISFLKIEHFIVILRTKKQNESTHLCILLTCTK